MPWAAQASGLDDQIATARPRRGYCLPSGSPCRYYLDMRIVIAGERSWSCPELAATILRRLVARHGPEIVIVHGDDQGVDESFKTACAALGIVAEERVIGQRQTGTLTIGARNRELFIGGADLCLVIHRSLASCKRTTDCAQQAIQLAIPTYLVEDDEGTPKRLHARDRRFA